MSEKFPICEERTTHPERIEAVLQHLPQQESLLRLAELYKVFGDGTRVRILSCLAESELCVCDIARLLSMQLSAISHQLRVLKQARLVKYRRCGKTVFYSLADDHVHSILAAGMEHVSEESGAASGHD